MKSSNEQRVTNTPLPFWNDGPLRTLWVDQARILRRNEIRIMQGLNYLTAYILLAALWGWALSCIKHKALSSVLLGVCLQLEALACQFDNWYSPEIQTWGIGVSPDLASSGCNLLHPLKYVLRSCRFTSDLELKMAYLSTENIFSLEGINKFLQR